MVFTPEWYWKCMFSLTHRATVHWLEMMGCITTKALSSEESGTGVRRPQWWSRPSTNMSRLHTIQFQLQNILKKAKSWLQEIRGKEGRVDEHRGCLGQWQYSAWRWWTHVLTHLSKPIEWVALRVNPNVNCALWMTKTCQCGFLCCVLHRSVVSDSLRPHGL